MAYLVNSSILINDNRELIGVNTAGISTALYVGENVQLDAASGIVTATEFIGIGSQLRDIPGLSWVASSAPAVRPNGDDLQDGDLYYDPTQFRQFTYYDGDAGGWRDSNPAANAALDYTVNGQAGQVIPGENTLDFNTSPSGVIIGINTATDTLLFGLDSDVEITNSLEVGAGVSVYMDGGAGIVTSANGTPVQFYGDGSGLTNLQISADQYLDVLGLQAGIVTATTELRSNLILGRFNNAPVFINNGDDGGGGYSQRNSDWYWNPSCCYSKQQRRCKTRDTRNWC